LSGEPRAQISRDPRVHQYPRALKILRGMKTGGKKEMPFEEGALASEDIQSVGHRPNYRL
jgi:hypothetical protein